MSIKKVWIESGCIVCRACEIACGELFDVRAETCVVRTRVRLAPLEQHIREAAAVCPVQVIKFSEKTRR